MNEIVKEIDDKRRKIREIDSLLEDFQNYFEKVGDKLERKSFKKMFKRITWFILGVICGSVVGWAFFQIALDFIKGLFA